MAGPKKGPSMAGPRQGGGTTTTTSSAASSYSDELDGLPPPPRGPTLALIQPSRKRVLAKTHRFFRLFRSIFRTFPVFTPKCKFPSAAPVCLPEGRKSLSGAAGTRVTGTLFGQRKGRVNLSLQEAPKCLPTLIVELAIPTHVLLREMSCGMVRVALECEKRPDRDSAGGGRSRALLDEPLWTMFCNGKKTGYGVKREASEEDIRAMELLRPVSMGAGVLPGKADAEGPDGEVAYMRANFEHVVRSRDSETLYMISPEGNNGPDLSIFFVRI